MIGKQEREMSKAQPDIITKIFTKEWYENKYGEWESFDWEDENGYSMVDNDWECIEVIDTDKFSHPTKALFKSLR